MAVPVVPLQMAAHCPSTHADADADSSCVGVSPAQRVFAALSGHSGTIPISTLSRQLHRVFSSRENDVGVALALELLALGDADGDGNVDAAEFAALASRLPSALPVLMAVAADELPLPADVRRLQDSLVTGRLYAALVSAGAGGGKGGRDSRSGGDGTQGVILGMGGGARISRDALIALLSAQLPRARAMGAGLVARIAQCLWEVLDAEGEGSVSIEDIAAAVAQHPQLFDALARPAASGGGGTARAPSAAVPAPRRRGVCLDRKSVV